MGTISMQRIKSLLVVRDRSHIDYYVKRLSDTLANAEAMAISSDVEIAVAGGNGSLGDDDTVESLHEQHHNHLSEVDIEDLKEGNGQQPYGLVKSHSPPSSTSSCYRPASEKDCYCAEGGEKSNPLLASKTILYSFGRPDIASFTAVRLMTGDETSIAVCGGRSLVATVRNSVASLSNERAVHKGTGAQGAALHLEEYCF
jgi:hypothetical protein